MRTYHHPSGRADADLLPPSGRADADWARARTYYHGPTTTPGLIKRRRVTVAHFDHSFSIARLARLARFARHTMSVHPELLSLAWKELAHGDRAFLRATVRVMSEEEEVLVDVGAHDMPTHCRPVDEMARRFMTLVRSVTFYDMEANAVVDNGVHVRDVDMIEDSDCESLTDDTDDFTCYEKLEKEFGPISDETEEALAAEHATLMANMREVRLAFCPPLCMAPDLLNGLPDFTVELVCRYDTRAAYSPVESAVILRFPSVADYPALGDRSDMFLEFVCVYVRNGVGWWVMRTATDRAMTDVRPPAHRTPATLVLDTMVKLRTWAPTDLFGMFNWQLSEHSAIWNAALPPPTAPPVLPFCRSSA